MVRLLTFFGQAVPGEGLQSGLHAQAGSQTAILRKQPKTACIRRDQVCVSAALASSRGKRSICRRWEARLGSKIETRGAQGHSRHSNVTGDASPREQKREVTRAAGGMPLHACEGCEPRPARGWERSVLRERGTRSLFGQGACVCGVHMSAPVPKGLPVPSCY